MQVVFGIAIYGERHLGMLLTNIFSIINCNPKAKIIVFWQDIDDKFIDILSKAFPVEFFKTNFSFWQDSIKRISSKTVIWKLIAHHVFTQRYKYLCLIDTDVLVIKDVSNYFNNYIFDILFTYKNERWSLNTGVLLIKVSQKSVNFFEEWENLTFSIINDKTLLKQSTSKRFPYGGADQMALYKMLGYVKGKKEYKIKIKKFIIDFNGIPCKELNETNSTKITNKTYIIHYKGGWQPILLEGKNFTKNRTKKDSWEMYILYLKTYINSVKFINRKLNSHYSLKTFKVKIPFYLTRDNLEERKILYYLYYLYHLPKTIMKLLSKYYVVLKSYWQNYLKCF